MSIGDLKDRLVSRPTINLSLGYSFDNSRMYLTFDGQKLDNLTMNIDQCDAMIIGLQGLKEAFIKHQGEKNG